METTQELEATATVPTPKASSYLQQLCKHFGHKVSASFDAQEGKVAFPFGDCALSVGDGGESLLIQLRATSPDDLARLKDVVGGHLERFAFREVLKVAWDGASPVGA